MDGTVMICGGSGPDFRIQTIFDKKFFITFYVGSVSNSGSGTRSGTETIMHSSSGFDSITAKVMVSAFPVPASQHREKEHGIAHFQSVSAFYRMQKTGQRHIESF